MYKMILKIFFDSKKVIILYILLNLFISISFYFLISLQQKICSYQNLLNNTLLGPFGLLEIKVKKWNKDVIKELDSLNIHYVLFDKKYIPLRINNFTRNICVIIWNKNYNGISNFLYSQFGGNIFLNYKKYKLNIKFKPINIGIFLPYNTIFLSKKDAIHLGLKDDFKYLSIKSSINDIDNISYKVSKIFQKYNISYKLINNLTIYYNKLFILKEMKILKTYISIVLYTLLVILLFFSFAIVLSLKKKSLKMLFYIGTNVEYIINIFLLIVGIINFFSLFIIFIIFKKIFYELLFFCLFIIIILYFFLKIYIRKLI